MGRILFVYNQLGIGGAVKSLSFVNTKQATAMILDKLVFLIDHRQSHWKIMLLLHLL